MAEEEKGKYRHRERGKESQKDEEEDDESEVIFKKNILEEESSASIYSNMQAGPADEHLPG